jgi:hypothetical protein
VAVAVEHVEGVVRDGYLLGQTLDAGGVLHVQPRLQRGERDLTRRRGERDNLTVQDNAVRAQRVPQAV